MGTDSSAKNNATSIPFCASHDGAIGFWLFLLGGIPTRQIFVIAEFPKCRKTSTFLAISQQPLFGTTRGFLRLQRYFVH